MDISGIGSRSTITPTGTAGTPSPPGFMDALDSVLSNAVYNPSATDNLHLQHHHHHQHQQLQHNSQHLQQQHHHQQHQYNQIPIDPSLVINWTTAAMNHLVSSSGASIPATTSLSAYDHQFGHNIHPSRGPTSGSSPSLSDNSDYGHAPHPPPQDFFGSAGNGFGNSMEPWSSVEVVPGLNGGTLSTVHGHGHGGGNTITGPTDGMWQGLLGIFDHQGM